MWNRACVPVPAPAFPCPRPCHPACSLARSVITPRTSQHRLAYPVRTPHAPTRHGSVPVDGCEVAACVGVCGQRNVGVWERVCICEMEARVGAWGCAGWSVGCVGGATWVWRVCVGVGGATRGGAWCHTCVAACGHALAGACIRATWERVGGATWHKDTGVREVGAGVPVGWVGGATWGQASGRGWAWERGSGATAPAQHAHRPCLPPQLAVKVLDQYNQKPAACVRRADVRQRGRGAPGHRADLRGRLHPGGPQAGPCEWARRPWGAGAAAGRCAHPLREPRGGAEGGLGPPVGSWGSLR